MEITFFMVWNNIKRKQKYWWTTTNITINEMQQQQQQQQTNGYIDDMDDNGIVRSTPTGGIVTPIVGHEMINDENMTPMDDDSIDFGVALGVVASIVLFIQKASK
eukprot:377309_1